MMRKVICSRRRLFLIDDKYCDVSVEYFESIESYMVNADFKKKGQTELIINTPEGTTKRYDLIIDLSSYEMYEK